MAEIYLVVGTDGGVLLECDSDEWTEDLGWHPQPEQILAAYADHALTHGERISYTLTRRDGVFTRQTRGDGTP